MKHTNDTVCARIVIKVSTVKLLFDKKAILAAQLDMLAKDIDIYLTLRERRNNIVTGRVVRTVLDES